jgi:hypothetical protein
MVTYSDKFEIIQIKFTNSDQFILTAPVGPWGLGFRVGVKNPKKP